MARGPRQQRGQRHQPTSSASHARHRTSKTVSGASKHTSKHASKTARPAATATSVSRHQDTSSHASIEPNSQVSFLLFLFPFCFSVWTCKKERKGFKFRSSQSQQIKLRSTKQKEIRNNFRVFLGSNLFLSSFLLSRPPSERGLQSLSSVVPAPSLSSPFSFLPKP